MALIIWTSMLHTGVSEQDTQHKKLVELINQLNYAMHAGKGKDVLGNVLSELLIYTVRHFDYEEKLMDEHNCEGVLAHKAEHQKFVDAVAGFNKKFHSGNAAITGEIMNFLREWLVNHIMKTDKKLGQSLNKLGVK